ncbi:hypothetical protein C7S20_04660 [Christiangramia fulva]|uniref:Uncharacterized protein n=1 Tax=Christiangramia fulva TaxID=2126553 RepID=A0A2R3Z304_9FLAO|nr:hypothetical protein [Christiangramia fulva]AVR44612.1 hypothetical protein C7S20_04660 [Christiangramia fulva]
MKLASGEEKIMLHQATALSLNEEGQFVHVLSIHSDISHLTPRSTNDISFINIKGGLSFYNVPTETGNFHPKHLKA